MRHIPILKLNYLAIILNVKPLLNLIFKFGRFTEASEIQEAG